MQMKGRAKKRNGVAQSVSIVQGRV